jgi:hypothetical protein
MLYLDTSALVKLYLDEPGHSLCGRMTPCTSPPPKHYRERLAKRNVRLLRSAS